MRTRREFLAKCSVAGMSAALAPSLLAAPRKLRKVELDDVKGEAFAQQVNSVFFAHTSVTRIPLWLAAIEYPRANGGLDAANEKFTLVFQGALDQPLGQDTYIVEHPSLGLFPLFLAHVGSRDTTCCYYEAVFNRPPHAARTRRRANNKLK